MILLLLEQLNKTNKILFLNEQITVMFLKSLNTSCSLPPLPILHRTFKRLSFSYLYIIVAAHHIKKKHNVWHACNYFLIQVQFMLLPKIFWQMGSIFYFLLSTPLIIVQILLFPNKQRMYSSRSNSQTFKTTLNKIKINLFY